MNSGQLSKHYSVLTAAERFPLMLAADARGDEAEFARLVTSAQQVAVKVSHTFGRAMAFREVHEYYRLKRLELAALYFNALWVTHAYPAAEAAACVPDAVLLLGYRVKVLAAGWKLFCDRATLDDRQYDEQLPGGGVLSLAEKVAETVAFTPEEVLAHVRRSHPEATSVETAESVAADLKSLFEDRLVKWG
jgi:hypothetical protein